MKLQKSEQFKGQWELIQTDGMDKVLLDNKELEELKKQLNKEDK